MKDTTQVTGGFKTASTDPEEAIGDLVTVRDWLRYGVSRFEQARLVYGHGTSRALDEMAFLLLSALELPIDQLEPWLDARLTRSERIGMLDLIERRIATRLPASYLVNRAWIGDYRFYVDERVIVPRSFIGELMLRDRLGAVVGDPDAVTQVLDLCTGSGCLAILAALQFPSAKVDAVDVSEPALRVASRNVVDYALEERISLVMSDLYSVIGGRRYDLIISNPPYVTTAAVAAFPPEYRAEPEIAHLGGADGLDVVRRIIDGAADMLTDGGALVVEIGQARTELEAAYPRLPFLWLDTDGSDGEVFALQRSDLLAAPGRANEVRSARGRRRET